MSTRGVALFGATLCATIAASVAMPEQVHIYLTGRKGEMGADFVTPSKNGVNCSSSLVWWGTSPSHLKMAKSPRPVTFFENVGCMHQVVMDGLSEGTMYYYQVGEETSQRSEMLNFTTLPGSNTPITYAVYADFGIQNMVSKDKLISEVGKDYHFVIHSGDFAYDFFYANSRFGNEFMNAIQPVASRVPYMGIPGNHEHHNNFTEYLQRFAGIGNTTAEASGSGTSMWYSFDVGLVHWVGINTEIYSYYENKGEQERMLNWLKADLEKANANRHNVPWVIAFGHKTWHMPTNWALLGPILQAAGVDVYFTGHVHNYERWIPMYTYDNAKKSVQDTGCLSNGNTTYTNPKYMTIIVSGSAGCFEKTVLCSYEGHGPEIAVCNHNYGYGYLTVKDAHTLEWKFEETGVAVGIGETEEEAAKRSKDKFIDHLTIKQASHGPRHITPPQE